MASNDECKCCLRSLINFISSIENGVTSSVCKCREKWITKINYDHAKKKSPLKKKKKYRTHVQTGVFPTQTIIE